MKHRRTWIISAASFLTTVFFLGFTPELRACGGFFCQAVPINQAGEQIIFRVDGEQVTAVVLIQYVGAAEDFSWVVPVVGIPELASGSDLIFSPLELATRPQFNLTVTGSACEPPPELVSPSANDGSSGGNAAENDNASDGVSVLEQLAVGPYDIQIVTSESSELMANWLIDNGYQLTDRGRELIDPYVTEDMNFVALKLQQDQDVGDIQPLIMRYQTDEPMVPIRLTAVAAQPDMGVLVWLLGESRGVPLNYLHVTPNYTLLNWYNGPFAAYASYQGLITLAMNEAGGQGFATDYAGTSIDIPAQLPLATDFEAELARINAAGDDAEFVGQLYNGFIFPSDTVLSILQRLLPVESGNEFWYGIPDVLRAGFTTEELANARTSLVDELQDSIIDPLIETLAVFEGDPYVTRFYTTLSPEEMTVDPFFDFNADLEDQDVNREATLDIRCTGGGTRWDLTLGAGTGRDGQRVINGSGLPPTTVGTPAIDQSAVFRAETLRTTGAGETVTENDFPEIVIFNDDVAGAGGGLCGNGSNICGTGATASILLTWLGFSCYRQRVKKISPLS